MSTEPNQLPPSLLRAIARRYDRRAVALSVPLDGGDECRVWRLATERDVVVVRMSPAWRTLAELHWVHELTRFCAAAVPEVIAPIPDTSGATVFLHGGRPVSLFPFIAGQPLDRESRALRQAAAHLLARLHGVMRAWPGCAARPGPGPHAPQPCARDYDPPELVDPALDAWHAQFSATKAHAVGPIHGDYYRRNVLCHGGSICGVIDWDESSVATILIEVAWATWEFAKVATDDDLHESRARAFLQAYRDAGGRCAEGDLPHIMPLIRWRLREEVRRSLGANERGEAWDRLYTEREMRAFARLRDRGV